MFLIDGPYVSDFLKSTIVEIQIPVVDTTEARLYLDGFDVNWVSHTEWQNSRLQERLYTNSENALSQLPQSSPLTKTVELLKNKLKFRQLLKDAFPDFWFREISLTQLQVLTPDDLIYPCVLKPTVGFFSAGVHVLETQADFGPVHEDILSNLSQSDFPKSVLDLTQFIAEAYLTGEEYAVDFYVNSAGDVVLLNLLHHRFSSQTDTSDRIYTTSLSLIEELGPKVRRFLQSFLDPLNVSGFPGHAEIRIDRAGKISFIEINPLRFGGWCTTGDMLGEILGFNAYTAFLNDAQPDWETVFSKHKDQAISLAILDNNSGISIDEIAAFDYDHFRDVFSDTVLLRKMDFKTHGFFGFAFLVTKQSNLRQIDELLCADMVDFISCRHGSA